MDVKCKDIHYSIGEKKILNGVSLKVEGGQFQTILGPNGSGKSTTINCVLSLLTYDRGSIKIFGEEMGPEKYGIKQKIGVVPQEIALFEELSVTDNINYFCGLYVQEKSKREQYVEEVIQLVGLEEFRKFYPRQLSGGLKRRLNIACGIVHKPELIFLDEPTVAVDPQSRNKILDSIKELNRQGATIVYTTHYMEEVEILCNHIVIIDQGQVIAEGSKEQLKNMVRENEKLIIEVPGLTEEQVATVEGFPSILEVTYDESYLKITTKDLKKALLPILNYFETEKIMYANIHTQEATLNDVFLEITGKELRD